MMRRVLAGFLLFVAPAARAWEAGPVSLGYRYTGGSDGYWGHLLYGRAVAEAAQDVDAYTTLDATTDQSSRWEASWLVGAERAFGASWQARLGAGYSRGEYRSSGESVGSFQAEAGVTRAVGRWAIDLEYELTAGRVGRVFTSPTLGHMAGPRPGSSPRPMQLPPPPPPPPPPGGGPAPSTTQSFTQHDGSLYLGGPLWRRLSFGVSVSGWTRGASDGWGPSVDLSLDLTRSVSLSAVGTMSISGGSESYYSGGGLGFTFEPSGSDP